jgi:leucyl aminopeptidase
LPTFELSSASPAEVAADLLIIPFFRGPTLGPGGQAVGKALGADLAATLKEQSLTGKVGQAFPIPTFGKLKAKTVLLVGLDEQETAGPAEIRRALLKSGARIARAATVATTLGQVGGDPEESAAAVAEGIVLGAYRFDRYKMQPLDEASKTKLALKKVVVLTGGDATNAKPLKASLKRGQIYAEAANWARDLVNTPAIDATPEVLAREGTKMAALYGLECKIWKKAELQKGGFGGILGVGQGSANEPRMIELTYRGAGKAQPVAITGKGITFDSGGLSLKASEGMETMKDDMGGAAAALAAMRAIAQLKPKINVIAAIPSSENMPSGSAIRPGDVLRHYGGKTTEVLNTDAEGRLVLADALAYLATKKPSAIIDSATLTGAAVVALGLEVFAIIGSDQQLIDDLLEAGREEGENGWQLPLWGDYRRHLESPVADVKNMGNRYGGAIVAGLFLKEFVGDVPWAHLDVAGPAFSEGSGDWPKGSTASPARTLIRFVENRAAASNGSGKPGSRSR